MIPPSRSALAHYHKVCRTFGTYLVWLILCILMQILAFAVVLPLNLIQLIFQITSFILLLCIAVIWLATCIQVGLHTFPTLVSRSNQSNVVGFVLSNFSFVLVLSRFAIDIQSWLFDSRPLPFLHGSTMHTHQSTFASFSIPYLLLLFDLYLYRLGGSNSP